MDAGAGAVLAGGQAGIGGGLLGRGEPPGVGEFGEDGLSGDGSDAGDARQQLAVGVERGGGGDEVVGLGVEAVGFLRQEGGGAGDRLPRRGGQSGCGEPGLFAGGELPQVVAAAGQRLQFPDFRGRRLPRGGPLAGRVLGDELGVGAVGLVALPAPQAGVLDAGRVDDGDVAMSVGEGGGQRLAVDSGALQTEAERGVAGVGVGPGEEGGMSGLVVGERRGSGLAAGGWQEAGVEGMLADIDADPGGRCGAVGADSGVVSSTSRMRGSGWQPVPQDGVRGR